MEYFSVKWCEDTLKTYLTKSAKTIIGTDRDIPYLKEVKKEDIATLYNVVNIWCNMYNDITQFDFLSSYIDRQGFFETVREAEALRLEYLSSDCNTGIFKTGTPWVHLRKNDVVDIIRLLGYPKRIHIVGSNLEIITREKFIQNNRRMKNPVMLYSGYARPDRMYNDCISTQSNALSSVYTERHNPRVGLFIIHVRKEMEKLFKGYKRDLDVFKLPSGSTYESKKSYVDKFEQLSANKSWLIEETGWRKDLFTASELDVPLTWENRLVCVPKNWKTYRTVCPEETARQVVGYTIAAGLRRCLYNNTKKRELIIKFPIPELRTNTAVRKSEVREVSSGLIDLTDQTRNQQLAALGSATGIVATVDFTAASDSISVALSKLIVPKRVMDDLVRVRARACRLHKNQPPMKLNTMMTMGHCCTFDLETAIFLSAAYVSVKDTWPYLSKEEKEVYQNKLSYALSLCNAYGDDVIIPSFAVDYYCTMMNYLGFIANKTKTFSSEFSDGSGSFTDNFYRESCGKEFYKGHDISVASWPRGTSKSEFAELLSQQHKLIDYPRANAFLIERIAQIHPSITTEDVDTLRYSIWVPGTVPESKPMPLYAKPHFRLNIVGQDLVELSIPITFWDEKHRMFSTFEDGKEVTYKLELDAYIRNDRIVLGTICKLIKRGARIQPVGSGKYDGLQVKKYAISNYEDRSIIDNRDSEPYYLSTVGVAKVTTEHDTIRRQKADDLAYALELARLARIPKGDMDPISSDTLLQSYDYDNLKNKILEGDRRIDSLCNPSSTTFKKKVVHI